MPSTFYTFPVPRKKRRFRALIPCLLSVGAIAIVAALVFWHRQPTAFPDTLTIPFGPDAAAWRIEIANESTQRGAQHFSGRFEPGRTFFVPADALFRVIGEPAGISGAFVENAANPCWDREGGIFGPAQNSEQECRAPKQPGLYHLSWQGQAASQPNRPALDVLVLTRAESSVHGDKTELKIDGTSIGSYHDPAQSPVRRVRENAQQYQVPRYFAALTPDTINLKLGPDFDLGQLIAFKDFHGPDGKKVFTTSRHTDVLPLRPELIDKLIKLRERLRSKGVKVTRFWITSGFRTPDYNRSIHGAAFSRHCYGDAVDLCIDEDNDKHMDDLNGDGKIDRKDGIVIADACRELEAEGAVVPGGIGVYEWTGDDSVRSHVHIDCRGYISRWGQIDSGRARKSFVWWPKGEFQEDENGE